MSIEVTVGAFMFMILLALSVFTIILSRDNIFTRSYKLEARFADVMGLRAGDSVYLHGMEVGKVSRLEVKDREVHLEASLRQPVQLFADYRLEIVEASVLGGRRMLIDVGSSDEPEVPKGTVLRGLPPKDLITEATEVINMVRASLEDGKVLQNLSEAMEHIRVLGVQLTSGEGTVSRLLTSDEVYNDLQAITGDLRAVADRLNSGEGTIGRLLADEDMYEDLQATMASLRQISEDIAEGKGLIGQLLKEDDPMAEDLAAALAAVREISEAIRDGEGSLGKLVRDEGLYDEFRQLITETRAAIDDFRETSPITTMTSIFFGAF